ncbi:SPOR domain-containing protein [PVC group bacterium]|nr:SPOR domain-containing protein [PVC group bacterium]
MTSKGKKRYRVYVGRFGALEDAKRTLEIILKRFSDSFIRKISQ